ncbi:MAG: winged helix-turn-helix domain-containing protein [Myxococcota bacterium]
MERFRVRDGMVDLVGRFVERDGHRVRLTALDARLLGYLAERAPRVVERRELLREVWGYGPGVRTETLEQAVRRLRTKLEPLPSKPVHLLTDRGIGYRLVLDRDTRMGTTEAPRLLLFGRDEALATLEAWLREGHRLLTVTGLGGIGKTRLARELMARRLADAPGERVAFVDLSSAHTSADIESAVARALGVLESAGALGAVLEQLGDLLLILDNVEQIVDPVGEFVLDWLTESPRLRMVCTSRRPLGGLHEQLLQLGPLEHRAALELWRRRTKGLRSFESADAGAVGAIVERLDRVPLAIEFAAARAGRFGPQDLLASLSRGLPPLRGAPERHTSLEACLQWSWGLLSAGERDVLRQCAVFRGGWSREASREVLRAEAEDPTRLVDGLVAQSMVRVAATADGETRFELFEIVRHFLDRRGAIPLVRRRHADHYARYGDAPALQALMMHPRHGRAAALELDNLRVALDWAVTSGEEELVALLAAALTRQLVDQPRTAVELLETAFAMPYSRPRVAVDLAISRARLLVLTHQVRAAHAVIDEAMAVPDLAADQRGRLLLRRARACSVEYRHAASLDAAVRALEAASGPHADWHRAHALELMADAEVRLHRLDDGRQHYHRALLLGEELGRVSAEGALRRGLGVIALTEGHVAHARAEFEAALGAERAFGSLGGELHTLWRIATCQLMQDDLEGSLASTERALVIAPRLGNPQLLGFAHYGVGSRLWRLGREAAARESLERARAIARRHGLVELADIVERTLLGEEI